MMVFCEIYHNSSGWLAVNLVCMMKRCNLVLYALSFCFLLFIIWNAMNIISLSLILLVLISTARCQKCSVCLSNNGTYCLSSSKCNDSDCPSNRKTRDVQECGYYYACSGFAFDIDRCTDCLAWTGSTLEPAPASGCVYCPKTDECLPAAKYCDGVVAGDDSSCPVLSIVSTPWMMMFIASYILRFHLYW